ncbi:hypothetical protein A0H81_04711 [Grifola frondosa]|uniref:Complex I-B15 n=1 Tax=Grifola frondosa TaxID=5627 RepID=A0A1C7ME15_GRIFR|nr:hypothetical protein A0H81_04711 [Grifola frondosa]
MAGGYMKHDAGIDRWNTMREDMYKHFRFTPRTVWQSIIGLVVFPGAVYYISLKTDSKWSWAGKLKGQPLARIPSVSESSD